MSLGIDLRADLLTVTAISNLVGTRIYPVVDRGEELPSLVYRVDDGLRESTITGSFGIARTSVTLDFYTYTYSDINTVKDAIISRYHGRSGQFASSGRFYGNCEIENINETFDDYDDSVYRCIIDLTFI